MKNLSFIFQYMFNPRSVGAILPSSKYLSKKMVKEIDFEQAEYIVEFGPGTGVFTENILKKRKQTTKVVLVENNKEFYTLLKARYIKEKNFVIIDSSAEYIEDILIENDIPYADYIISGLPFASLPKNVSSNILRNSLKVLKEDGLFITFQYTKFKLTFLESYFSKIDINREIRNFPPAYIMSCKK
ncbi:class I SAM-dependent methyltransferase [Lysinibacillus sp. fkY74-1]|uniref:SAM-dependent methyltransferase n=3 Tax=Lysinibacillus TaxID=400634 RepID=B1HNE5_LYSSC|nr:MULTISPECIES: rRNA adenine N-6-methyltransferase family protein [Lysinibacillus]MBE5083440.1 methyltransferase [Bacillus thuringiensis]ACA40455.1 conserved hypothetical protein [Lysinibacillus sphaericus C3-41]AMO33532.1 SAM-dependent methyltransferase [Lysinibacillus sphaericus]AMR91362.1 SAM-dependent methyltransferase [Lysinibacillus sphaericus]ANA45410.1 SAM-dependent methyltransferase [Lysinibacillus sphaericus]